MVVSGNIDILQYNLRYMKKMLSFFITTIIVLLAANTYAQSFSIEKDTVKIIYHYTGSSHLYRDSIVPPASGSVILNWKVKATNFPADWLNCTTICDNRSCYNWSMLWVSGAGINKTSDAYGAGAGFIRDFHLGLDFDTVHSSGTYYLVLSLASGLTDTTQVYQVTYIPTAVPTIANAATEVQVYPNPTTNDINVVYSPAADIKTISVYSIIGKPMAIYKTTTDNSANLSLENVPAGIYFMRLINASGEVVTTRKFTKQ